MASLTTTNFGFPWAVSPKCGGGVLHPDGKIYCAPNGIDSILVIDPSDNTAVLNDFGNTDWRAGYRSPVVAANGKVYFIFIRASSNNGGFLVIDPSDNTSYTLGGYNGLSSVWFSSAALGSDNDIYLAKFNRNHVYKIDPDTDTFLTVFPTGKAGSQFFSDVVAAPNGKLYFIPSQSTTFGIYNPADDTWVETDFGVTLPNVVSKWRNGVLKGDTIYCVPGPAWTSGIFTIDTSTDTAFNDTSYIGTIPNDIVSGALASDDRIYCTRGAVRDFYRIGLTSKVIDLEDFGIPPASRPNYDVSLVRSGEYLYGIPSQSDVALIIHTPPDPVIRPIPRKMIFRPTTLDLKANKFPIPEPSGRTGIRLSKKNFTHEFGRVMHVGDTVSIALDWSDLLIGSQEYLLTFGAESRDLTVETITFDANNSFIRVSGATTTSRSIVTLRALTSEGRELVRDIVVRTQYEPTFPVPTPP